MRAPWGAWRTSILATPRDTCASCHEMTGVQSDWAVSPIGRSNAASATGGADARHPRPRVPRRPDRPAFHGRARTSPSACWTSTCPAWLTRARGAIPTPTRTGSRAATRRPTPGSSSTPSTTGPRRPPTTACAATACSTSATSRSSSPAPVRAALVAQGPCPGDAARDPLPCLPPGPRALGRDPDRELLRPPRADPLLGQPPAGARGVPGRSPGQGLAGPAPARLHAVPRAGRDPPARLVGRPHARGRPRGPELPRLPLVPHQLSQGVVRRVPPGGFSLRDRGPEDGHDLPLAAEPAQRPHGRVLDCHPGGIPARKLAGGSPADLP